MGTGRHTVEEALGIMFADVQGVEDLYAKYNRTCIEFVRFGTSDDKWASLMSLRGCTK